MFWLSGTEFECIIGKPVKTADLINKNCNSLDSMLDRLQAQMRAMQMLMKAQEVTANNLANINTPGFKGSNVFYQLVKSEVDGEVTTATIPGQQVDMSQGVLEATGNKFDFAIRGEGFFMVRGEGGRYLTRNGRFHIDTNGYLVDGNGSKVMGSAGPVYIPQYLQATDSQSVMKLEVGSDGTIRLNDEVYDKLRLVEVEDPSQLERRGNSYFEVAGTNMLANASGSSVMQGYYEKGNVSSLNEMVDMMRTMKMFESQQRAIRTTDEMLGKITSNLGRF